MKAAASAAGSHLKEFGHAASAKVASAADAARQASSDAAKDIKKSAQQMGSSSGSGLIGQSLTVGGRALYVDSLLAEGGFGSVYSAEVVEADPTKRSQVPDKVVLKRMFAGVSVRARAGVAPRRSAGRRADPLSSPSPPAPFLFPRSPGSWRCSW